MCAAVRSFSVLFPDHHGCSSMAGTVVVIWCCFFAAPDSSTLSPHAPYQHRRLLPAADGFPSCLTTKTPRTRGRDPAGFSISACWAGPARAKPPIHPMPAYPCCPVGHGLADRCCDDPGDPRSSSSVRRGDHGLLLSTKMLLPMIPAHGFSTMTLDFVAGRQGGCSLACSLLQPRPRVSHRARYLPSYLRLAGCGNRPFSRGDRTSPFCIREVGGTGSP